MTERRRQPKPASVLIYRPAKLLFATGGSHFEMVHVRPTSCSVFRREKQWKLELYSVSRVRPERNLYVIALFGLITCCARALPLNRSYVLNS